MYIVWKVGGAVGAGRELMRGSKRAPIVQRKAASTTVPILVRNCFVFPNYVNLVKILALESKLI